MSTPKKSGLRKKITTARSNGRDEAESFTFSPFTSVLEESSNPTPAAPSPVIVPSPNMLPRVTTPGPGRSPYSTPEPFQFTIVTPLSSQPDPFQTPSPIHSSSPVEESPAFPFETSHPPLHQIPYTRKNQDGGEHLGLEEYIKKRRELLEVLSSLHATGVQKELDLPQIVVVGSQSVGKSSLIESMSGITLPRDSGTCTRCPMECRLQYAPTWSCKVVLRFHVDSTGNSLLDIHEKPFGPIITTKDDVSAMLRRAQRAILRPTLDPSVFLDDSDLQTPGHPGLSFSSNTVCIRVAGPSVPDLYFYDLPGIIANVSDGGNEKDIRLVEELATNYMSKANCIILLVISCETDFENQGAGRLVLKNQHLRDRTVGVLTKVDRIEPGTSAKWVNILKNKENMLRNGWYGVKQPNARELESGISWEEARDNEDGFFRLTEPWASIALPYRTRMGSSGLTDHLSTLLSDLVSQKLPVIRGQISCLLHHVEKELQKIPAPNITDPRREVITIVRDFRKIVSKHIQGLSPDAPDSPPNLPGLMNSINGVYENFKLGVNRTAPQFRPWDRARGLLIENTSLEEMIKAATLDDAPGTVGPVLHVDEVMDMAKRARTRELPGNYPFLVKENLIRSFLKSWSLHANNCFDNVKKLVIEQIERLIRLHFGKYSHSGMMDEIRSVVTKVIEDHATSTREKIEALCSIEELPYTQNEEYFLQSREHILDRYKAIHRQSLGQQNVIQNLKKYQSSGYGTDPGYEIFWGNVNKALSYLQKLGIADRQATDLALLLPKNALDPALEIMAEVRAYFQVAYKRFSDTIPQQIDTEFIRGFDNNLDIALMYLELSTERCLEFLQEDSDTIHRRQELLGKKKRLLGARDKLRATGQI